MSAWIVGLGMFSPARDAFCRSSGHRLRSPSICCTVCDTARASACSSENERSSTSGIDADRSSNSASSVIASLACSAGPITRIDPDPGSAEISSGRRRTSNVSRTIFDTVCASTVGSAFAGVNVSTSRSLASPGWSSRSMTDLASSIVSVGPLTIRLFVRRSASTRILGGSTYIPRLTRSRYASSRGSVCRWSSSRLSTVRAISPASACLRPNVSTPGFSGSKGWVSSGSISSSTFARSTLAPVSSSALDPTAASTVTGPPAGSSIFGTAPLSVRATSLASANVSGTIRTVVRPTVAASVSRASTSCDATAWISSGAEMISVLLAESAAISSNSSASRAGVSADSRSRAASRSSISVASRSALANRSGYIRITVSGRSTSPSTSWITASTCAKIASGPDTITVRLVGSVETVTGVLPVAPSAPLEPSDRSVVATAFRSARSIL